MRFSRDMTNLKVYFYHFLIVFTCFARFPSRIQPRPFGSSSSISIWCYGTRYEMRRKVITKWGKVCWKFITSEKIVLWNLLWSVSKSHNKMANSMSKSHNIPENIRVLGFSLTRIIVLYGQNEYLAITFGIFYKES